MDGLGPAAILASAQPGAPVWVACANSREILEWQPEPGTVAARIALPGAPSGMAWSTSSPGSFWVTCAGAESQVCLVRVGTRSVEFTLPAGHTALAPVERPDGRELYICNRYRNEVAVYDVPGRREVARIAVPREPVAAAITPDGRLLFVANHLHAGRADEGIVAAEVSVIDTAERRVRKSIPLPHGSGLLLGVAVSPDGRHVAVTHNLGRPNLPATQVDRGWINTAALSLIDAREARLINTVLLDSVDLGAANPWGVAWTRDGRSLLVTHAGTHELSVIDAPELLARLAALPTELAPGQTRDIARSSHVASDVPSDLAFLVGIRDRIPLPGRGPRDLAVATTASGAPRIWVANHFSDSLDRVDLEGKPIRPGAHRLGPERAMSLVRRGEFYFNDATLCFQHWQNCASCHSFDARVDGLNWDQLNDGIGNPKNNKSLLWSHRTPPAMSEGVRETAEEAVRGGIRHALFTVQPPEVAEAIDAYLKALEPMPSPYRVNGQLTESARHGERIFNDAVVGCADCHPPGLFTSLKRHDVGTQGRFDRSSRFDTPTLVELWRTGPYLHDGSALTIREVLTTRNNHDDHGKTSHLNPAQIDDLVAYVLSQ